MIEIRQTKYFAEWLSGLHDHRARGELNPASIVCGEEILAT